LVTHGPVAAGVDVGVLGNEAEDEDDEDEGAGVVAARRGPEPPPHAPAAKASATNAVNVERRIATLLRSAAAPLTAGCPEAGSQYDRMSGVRVGGMP
jgi:hypothetical protein